MSSRRLNAVTETVLGVTCIADDVLAKVDSKISHDVAVLSLLETAQTNNLRFNPDKIQDKTRQCMFLWQFHTPDGMRVDTKKVDAISQLEAPQCKRELESLHCMVNYLKHYSS